MTTHLQRVLVEQVIKEPGNACSFVLRPVDWVPEYKTGQFLTLVFGEKRRSYSLISQPEDPLLKITVKRVVNGEFSRKLIDHAMPGDEWITAGISGYFVLPDKINAYDHYFFLAAGSGITPVLALIEFLLQHHPAKKITLVYSNSNMASTIFKNRLEHLQQANPQLTIEWLYSNRLSVRHGRLSNHLLKILLKTYVTNIDNTLFYLCGPFDYMLMARITLLIYGAAPGNIKKEQFSTLPRLVQPEPPDKTARQVTVITDDKTYHLNVQYPKTILAAAKAQHILLPYSCEAGRCGSCVATCLSGKTWMAYNEVLTDDEIKKGRVLLCQGYPVEGDVTVRI